MFLTIKLCFWQLNSCRILHHWTNNKKLVDVQKYNLYFYSSTVTIVCHRNTVRESSHISFFFLWSSMTVREHTQWADRSAFKSHAEVWTSSSLHIFFCLWLVIGTYILLAFFSSNLLILSANRNICHSIHRQ